RRAGRAHIHRIGEQAVLAFRIVARRRSLSRQGCARDRSARYYRADTPQLCTHCSHGGLHSTVDQPDATLIISVLRPAPLDFDGTKLDIRAEVSVSQDG